MSDVHHRRPRHRAPTTATRLVVALSSRAPSVLGGLVAVATTAAVAAGVTASGGEDPAEAAELAGTAVATATTEAESAEAPSVRVDGIEEQAAVRRKAATAVSRSAQRTAPTREAEPRDRAAGTETSRSRDEADKRDRKEARLDKPVAEVPTDPRVIAQSMLAEYGWDSAQWPCLDQLWIGESGWDHTATNPTSGAYGIPQSLPAEKMASAGPDWRTNPATQIAWGLEYISLSYGTPCAANSFKLANNWY